VTLSRRELVALLEENGLAPSRALGQNFVVDPNTVRRIARLAEVGPGDRVVEIGAGLGSLTLALVETGASVTAVEIDRHLVPVLRRQVEPAGVTVVEGDAMRLDWTEVLGPVGDGAPRWVLVANLPYNVATPLVADLLDQVPAIERMLVMVQREVAERLAAGVGDAGYGAVSVKVAYWASAKLAGRVPASVFVPRPNVESALVSIRRHPQPAVDPGLVGPDALFSLVRAGFSQRRKMLRSVLAGRVTPEAFEQAGVAPTARAEELDVVAWGRLAAAVAVQPDRPEGVGQ
jgi:16S rRNA (adenine1518-N6/adenine1519-N6)-dimethyltransferase